MATIVEVRTGAGHDGAAELIVTIEYENGVTNDVPLDHYAGTELLRISGAAEFQDLVGRPWNDVKRALSVAHNRHMNLNPS